ncbi:MAG: TerC family protein [Candidatus Brevundimonas colombiensis]|uniref:TerC family protein n=1 Tax=Candidatus Brevundimonas colombiensis TaxID=3121376 RepID=A0AAJ5X231_9CAUL|nr:TerC family protein [Brevundimonas sp.]WEK41005.1 MAG: TerC family protein [Brevundimonas sp.]
MLDSITPLFSDPAAWAALVTLIVMEVVLGIDNLIFISILSNKLPEHQRSRVRRIGIGLALVMRLALLSIIAWLVGLVQPVFTVMGNEFSWKDLILIAGGLFLVWKATKEIHHTVDPTPTPDVLDKKDVMITNAGAAIVQIIILDIVFSIDSILTAVGMTEHLPIMVVAVLVAVTVMLLAADPLANFINKNPSVVMLALGFLLMIGMVLIADGFGYHVPKGYIYAAMAFSAGVEALNMLGRRSASKKEKAELARSEANAAEARARKAEAEAAAERG